MNNINEEAKNFMYRSKLVASNLPYDITENEIDELFGNYYMFHFNIKRYGVK